VHADNCSLEYLNCQPVRFAEDVDKCFQYDFPDGLNSQKSFHYIFLDTQIIDKKMLARMKELQPEAKVSRLQNHSVLLVKAAS
jgi:hypothetical protein